MATTERTAAITMALNSTAVADDTDCVVYDSDLHAAYKHIGIVPPSIQHMYLLKERLHAAYLELKQRDVLLEYSLSAVVEIFDLALVEFIGSELYEDFFFAKQWELYIIETMDEDTSNKKKRTHLRLVSSNTKSEA